MSDHPFKLSGHVCIDTRGPGRDGNGVILVGWILASHRIIRLLAENSEGRLTAAWVGMHRPDLTKHFPENQFALTAGFLAKIPNCIDSMNRHSSGHWLFEVEGRGWYRMRSNWTTMGPLSLALAEPITIPSNTMLEVASTCDDPEVRLQLALSAGSGISVRLDISNKCNLRCVMCHYRNDEVFYRPAKFITPQALALLLTPLRTLVREVVLSCGDEPLTSKHFITILACVRKCCPGAIVEFTTNGMLMNNSIRRQIIEQQVDRVNISLDGATAKTVESIRIGARYSRIVLNVKALAELKQRVGSSKPTLRANFVMMTDNVHEVVDFIQVIAALGIMEVDFRHVVQAPDDVRISPRNLSTAPEKYNYYRILAIEKALRIGMAIHMPPPFEGSKHWSPGTEERERRLDDFYDVMSRFIPDTLDAPLRIVDHAVQSSFIPSLEEVFSDAYCHRPFSEILIRNENEMLPCAWHGRVLEELADGSDLGMMFFGAAFRDLRRNMYHGDINQFCIGCPVKDGRLPSKAETRLK